MSLLANYNYYISLFYFRFIWYLFKKPLSAIPFDGFSLRSDPEPVDRKYHTK